MTPAIAEALKTARDHIVGAALPNGKQEAVELSLVETPLFGVMELRARWRTTAVRRVDFNHLCDWRDSEPVLVAKMIDVLGREVEKVVRALIAEVRAGLGDTGSRP